MRQALLPVLMSCATSAGNVKTMEELLNQVNMLADMRDTSYFSTIKEHI